MELHEEHSTQNLLLPPWVGEACSAKSVTTLGIKSMIQYPNHSTFFLYFTSRKKWKCVFDAFLFAKTLFTMKKSTYVTTDHYSFFPVMMT